MDPEAAETGRPSIARTSSFQTFTCQHLRSAFLSGLLESADGWELTWLHCRCLGLPGRCGCRWWWEGRRGTLALEYLGLGRVGGGLAWGCPGMGTRHSLELTLMGHG